MPEIFNGRYDALKPSRLRKMDYALIAYCTTSRKVAGSIRDGVL